MMSITDLKFCTNEPERDLYTRFAAILKSNTQFFDVLVGYFRTSGFFRMWEAMQSVEKIRILVGLNVDHFMNIPDVWPTIANLRYIIMSVLEKCCYNITPSTYLSPLDVISILLDIANSKTEDKKYDLLFRECEMRIGLCQQMLCETKELMQCFSIHKEEDYFVSFSPSRDAVFEAAKPEIMAAKSIPVASFMPSMI